MILLGRRSSEHQPGGRRPGVAVRLAEWLVWLVALPLILAAEWWMRRRGL